MKKSDIEYMVLRVIERIENKQQLEDSRIELKAVWPDDPKRAARRIAGHANASRGEPILWIIGIDEDKGVIGADKNDLANWYPKVISHFDGVSPELTELVIPVSGTGKSVVALLFEVDRPPYVVKGIEGGAVDREVPWREGTKTRSAYRSDLLKILVEQQSVPQLEVRSGYINFTSDGTWEFRADVYIVSKYGQTLVIPFHKCRVWVEVQGYNLEIDLSERITLTAPVTSSGAYAIGMGTGKGSLTIGATNNEIIINGPGLFFIFAGAKYQPTMSLEHVELTIHALLQTADSGIEIYLQDKFSWTQTPLKGNQFGRWQK